jgi:hypothetical protein
MAAFVANVRGKVSMNERFAVFSSSSVTGSRAIRRSSSSTIEAA